MEWLALLQWLLVPALLGALCLPLVGRLCPHLPRRGATAALPLALATITLVVYWLGQVSYGLPTVVAGVLVLAVAAGLASHDLDFLPIRGYAEALGVYLLGFSFAVLVTAPSPEIMPGAENLLNFGLLQSILRAPSLPPEDMWFAGERVYYYYGGHLLTAWLAELTGTPGRLAYNLGFAVVYGALLSTAYGAGAAIVGDRSPRWLSGGLAAFFVGLASNLYVPVRRLLSALPRDVADPVASLLDVTLVGAGGATVFDPVHFSFTNTDFPVYSVLLGTLHAHVASTVFLALLILLMAAYYRTPPAERRRRLALLAVSGGVIGVVAFVNTWSLPTGIGLVAVSLLLSPHSPRSLLSGETAGSSGSLQNPRAVLERVGWSTAATAVVATIAVAVVAPFLLAGTPRGVGVGLLPSRSPWHYYVLAYGGVLGVFALYAIPRVVATVDAGDRRRALGVAAGVAVVLGVAALAFGFSALALVLPLGLAGAYLSLRDPDAGYETVLLVAGAGLVLVVELLYVAEPASPAGRPRFNTAYKTYMQAWIVWGVAAGAALARVLGERDGPTIRSIGGRWRVEVVAVLLVLSLSVYGLVYAGGAAADLAGGAEASVDGVEPLERYYPDRFAAIGWLSNASGHPRLVSAPAMRGTTYTIDASPAASYTGIPTLVGWAHEADYRGAEAFQRRVAVVDEIYTGSPERRAELLAEHDVSHVWVGYAERGRYESIALSAEEPWLSLGLERGPVRIYAVDRSALPDE